MIAALVMLLLVIPSALATPTDWVRLNLEVVWTREDGTSESYEASPVYEMPYSFWVRVPEEALGSLKLRVSHSSHNYFYIPESGSPLTDVVPVDVSPDGKTYTMIQAVEGGTVEAYYLYISTASDIPVIPTPTPTPSPTPEPTPTPTPTPEPTEEPTPSPTPEPTPTPTPTPEPTPTPSPTPTPEPEWMEAEELPADELINRYGKTMRNDVRFRQGIGTGTRMLAELKKGTFVYIIHNVVSENGDIWSRVEVNGIRGYIMSKYLNAYITQEKSDAYAATLENPVKPYTWEDLIETPEPETPAPAKKPSATEAPAPETEAPADETPGSETETPAAEVSETEAPEEDELETVTVEEPVEPTPAAETEAPAEEPTPDAEPETPAAAEPTQAAETETPAAEPTPAAETEAPTSEADPSAEPETPNAEATPEETAETAPETETPTPEPVIDPGEGIHF